MGDILVLLPRSLGQLLNFIYDTLAFHNYGLAIIIFTVIVKLCLLPLTLKQFRSSTAMQALQPQLQELQKRYKNDKQKLQIETMAFYKENKVNPAGGCLPLLIQLPILFSLWQVIARPMTYMLGREGEVAGLLAKLPEAERIKGYDELSVVIHGNILDMNFLGLNLGIVPSFSLDKLFNNPMSSQYLALLIIPILATVTTYLSSKFMMIGNKGSLNTNTQMASMNKTMLYVAPLMTLVFSFQFPAGLGLYWIVGYVIQIFQQLYINKTILKKTEVVSK